MSGYQLIGYDPNLVAGWDCRQSPAGSVPDAGPSGFTGTIIGNPRQRSDKFGEALQFDGVGEYVDCGDEPEFDFITDFTALFVIKGTHTPSVNEGILTKFETTKGYDFGLNTDGTLRATIRGTSSIDTGGSGLGGSLLDGIRHIMGVVCTNASIDIFKDGAHLQTKSGTWTPTVSIESLKLGTRGASANRFGGQIYTAAIYNKAKSAAWWAQEYNRAKLYF